jgi:hypothetical protein
MRSPVAVAAQRSVMDIDNQNQRTKYAGASSHHQHSQQQQQYHQSSAPGSSSSSKPVYECRGSRSNRGTREGELENDGQNPPQQHRSSSGRGSSSSARHSSRVGGGTTSSSRSSSRYTQQPQQQQQQSSSGGGSSYHHPPSSSSQYAHHQSSRQGPTNAPPSSMMTPATTNQHFTPPQGHFGQQQQHRNHVAPHTPDQSLQPTFPPPAVTSESPPPSEQSQRRPAYLLHRDLVIGKGSYGQVCIASRGEAEGHMSGSGRSGKRKKFACKCVMLRNDPKYISKLQEEVNVLRELRGHDNVIRLYDVFCVDNELFIITELGRGGDLFHLLTTHPKHGVTEAYAGKYIIIYSIIFR